MAIRTEDWIVQVSKRDEDKFPGINDLKAQHLIYPDNIQQKILRYLQEASRIYQLKTQIAREILEWAKSGAGYTIGDKILLKDSFCSMNTAIIEDIVYPMDANFINPLPYPENKHLFFARMIKKNGELSERAIYIAEDIIKQKLE